MALCVPTIFSSQRNAMTNVWEWGSEHKPTSALVRGFYPLSIICSRSPIADHRDGHHHHAAGDSQPAGVVQNLPKVDRFARDGRHIAHQKAEDQSAGEP